MRSIHTVAFEGEINPQSLQQSVVRESFIRLMKSIESDKGEGY